MSLNKAETKLLRKDEDRFLNDSGDQGIFGKLLHKDNNLDREILTLAAEGGELTEEEQVLVRRELMRRQVREFGPEFETFASKLVAQDGKVRELLQKADKGEIDFDALFAFMLLEYSLQPSENPEGAVAEAESKMTLMDGSAIHEFGKQRIGSKEIEESTDVKVRAYVRALQTLKSLDLDTGDNMKTMSRKDLLKKVEEMSKLG